MNYNWMADNVHDEIILDCAIDWVSSSELFYMMTKYHAEDRKLIRDLGLGVILSLLVAGLIEVGDIGEGFEVWQLPPGDTVIRIAEMVLEYVHLTNPPGDILFWVKLTEKGRRYAKELQVKWDVEE